MQIFVSFFVKFGDGVAYIPGIAEEGTGRVEALAGDLGDGAVEIHLAADLVASIPGVGLGSGRSVLEAVRRHADIETDIVGGIEFAGTLDLVRPPMREDFVVRPMLWHK